MKNILYSALICAGMAVSFTACELDEYNPNEVTGDEKLSQYETYMGLVNQCYQPLINALYQSSDYVIMCEAGTDLWQTPKNSDSSNESMYYENFPADKSYPWKVWQNAYSMINICNTVVDRADAVTDAPNDEVMLYAVAQARCLRAYYYSILVEQFGNVTLSLADASTTPDLVNRPQRSEVADIYAAIVEDLKFAAANLPVSWDASEYSRVTKKAALGLLCRAYIQGAAYGLDDNGVDYLEMAYNTATDFIENKSKYGAELYDDFSQVFNELNNRGSVNKEYLFVAAGAVKGSDAYNNGNYSQCELFRHFLPSVFSFTDLGLVDKTSNFIYGRPNSNVFLPSKYLMECMTADPNDVRYRYSFISTYAPYTCELWGETFKYGVGLAYAKTIDQTLADKYGIDARWNGTTIFPHFDLVDNSTGEIAVWNANGTEKKSIAALGGNVLHPELPLAKPVSGEDWQYSIYCSTETLTAEEKAEYPCFVVNVFDLYNADGTPKTTTNINGVDVQYETSAYPALSKFNMPGKDAFGSNAQRKTIDVGIMRFAEVYLIAAEAAVRLGKGDADDYINVLRGRANASAAPASITMDYVYDEYARELCGEFQRWYLLKRNKAFEDRLEKYNPRAFKSFKSDTHYVRPIPQKFLDAIYNREEFGQNHGY